MLPLIGIVTTGVQVVGAIKAGGKDPGRLAANKAALSAALAGDDNALLFLRQRTGEHGIEQVPGYGEVGGWGSQLAKDDAKVKYAAALAARRGQTALTTGGGATIIDQVATKLGVSVWPWTRAQITTAVLVGLGVVVLIVVMRRRRRRA